MSALPALCQSSPQRVMSWAPPRPRGIGCIADLQLVHQQSPHPLGSVKNTCGMQGLVQPESWQSAALPVTDTGGKHSALSQWALTLLTLQVWHSLLDLFVI